VLEQPITVLIDGVILELGLEPLQEALGIPAFHEAMKDGPVRGVEVESNGVFTRHRFNTGVDRRQGFAVGELEPDGL
jgi:hypothetical protein